MVSTGTTGDAVWQTDDKSRKDLYVPPFYSQPSHFSEYKTYKNWSGDRDPFSDKKQAGILNKDVEMEDYSDKDIDVAIANA